MTIGSLNITADYQEAVNPLIGMAVLSKSLDTAEIAGQDMIKMMEQSVNPYLGQNVDITL